jgi:hypothetical protein
MKNKFNAGDEVIYISKSGTCLYKVANQEIDTVLLTKNSISGEDIVDYRLTNIDGDVPESYLYTKEEAIEFLKGVL